MGDAKEAQDCQAHQEGHAKEARLLSQLLSPPTLLLLPPPSTAAKLSHTRAPSSAAIVSRMRPSRRAFHR